MKLYLIFILFLLASCLCSNEAEGTRLGKVLTLSPNRNQEIIKIPSIRRDEYGHELKAKTDEVTTGVNRKLMTKIASSITTTTASKNHRNEENKNNQINSAYTFNLLPESFQREKDVVYPKDINVLDYTPARKNPPIHN